MARATASSSTFFAVLGSLLLASAAYAGDPVEEARVAEAATFLANLETWNEAASKPDIERALPKLEKIHNELQTSSVRDKLQRAAGDLLANEGLGGLLLSVADTCGRLNDPKGMWSILRRHLPSVKDEAVGPLPLRVVQAIGALAPDDAIASLEQIMEKAKDNNASRYAVQALGKYSLSKHRTKVLASLLETLRKLQPGVGGGQGRGGGAAARERYQFLEATFVGALAELTGQKKYDAVEPWLEAYKTHKKKLDELFTSER